MEATDNVNCPGLETSTQRWCRWSYKLIVDDILTVAGCTVRGSAVGMWSLRGMVVIAGEGRAQAAQGTKRALRRSS